MTTLDERRHLGSGPLSPRYEAALAFAATRHASQTRKGSRVPYLSHLMSVSALVLEHYGTEDEAIAGLLHDVVEDAPEKQGGAVLELVGQRFGDEVHDVVRACSDGLDEAGNRSGGWVQRKTPYVSALAEKSQSALLVTAADKTHNATCLAADARAFGRDFLASTFTACLHQQLWYYVAVQAAVAAHLRNPPAVEALGLAVDALVLASGEARPAVTPEPERGCCAKGDGNWTASR